MEKMRAEMDRVFEAVRIKTIYAKPIGNGKWTLWTLVDGQQEQLLHGCSFEVAEKFAAIKGADLITMESDTTL